VTCCAGPEASGEIASIPLSGPVTLIGNNYDFGPRDAASDVVQLNAVMTAVREGGNPTVPGTATVDVPDMAGATAINLIYSAIGLNDSIAGSGNDAVFTVNYRDGSQDSFVWDVVDWVETSLSPLYDFAAGGLDLRSTANGGLYFDEQGRLFEQTFTVDSGKIIDSFGFDVSGMNDTGQQTNVLVFAASATGFVSLAEPAIVPAPAALGLLAVAALGIVATRRH